MLVGAQPKNCPRCQSFMIFETDHYGKFGTCVICGYVSEDAPCDPEIIAEELRLVAGKQRRRQPSHGFMRL